MAAFWKRVSKCKHERLADDYCVHVGCSMREEGCSGGSEAHCLDCGVYICEDPCGENSGMSGWPHKRWLKANRNWDRFHQVPVTYGRGLV